MDATPLDDGGAANPANPSIIRKRAGARKAIVLKLCRE
jgi:hypothetical protein